MFTRKFFAAISFVAAIPTAMAAPIMVTTTAKGVIAESTWQRYSDIRPGDTFEVTSVTRFNDSYVTEAVGGLYQWTYGSFELFLKVNNQAFHISSTTWGASLDDTHGSGEGDGLGLSATFEGGSSTYGVTYSTNLEGDTYAPPWILSGGPNSYNFSAPFVTRFSLTEISSAGVVEGLLGDSTSMQIVVSSVPEPATYAMLGAGLGLMALARRKRRTASETSLA